MMQRSARLAFIEFSTSPVRVIKIIKVSKISKLFAKVCNFLRARSRLYQNEILQENMRLTAFFKFYNICTLLHRCNLKILAKHRFEISNFRENSAKFLQMLQNLQNIAKFQNFQLDNLVDFEKC